MEIKAKPSLINVRSNPISSFFIGLTALSLLIALNHWVFARYFNTGYLQWYFSNAAAIGIGSALFSTIWGVLDKHPDVISAHPMKFAGTYMGLIGTFFFTLSSTLRGDSEKERAPDFDSFAAVLLSAILIVVIILGLLLIGPLQYFVFLVCGSLGRFVLRSDRRVIMHETNDTTELREIHDGSEVSADWQDISLQNKPFTLTNVIVGLLAGVLNLVKSLGQPSN